jgi:hypothetical protein
MKQDDSQIIDYLIRGNEQSNLNKPLSYSYIANPDQTIRWVYPSKLKAPTFLNFYNSSSFRAKIFTIAIKILFALKLSNLIRSDEVFLSVHEGSLLQRILDKYPGYNHSIFTGTVGKNRKIIVELNNGYKSLVFVKVAISNTSKDLIQNEFHALNKLNDEKLTSIHVPKVLYYSEKEFLEIGSIKPKRYKQPSKLIDIQIVALAQINSINHKHVLWKDMQEKFEIESIIENLKVKAVANNGLDRQRIGPYIENLSLLYKVIGDEARFSCGLAHGDFTPWNMYINHEKLYIYDWELSKETMPVLFDLFHYIFQSEVMVNRSDYVHVKNEIERVLGLISTKQLIKKFDVNINRNFIFYLIYISSYYIDIYSEQEKLHMQAFWLFDVWDDAISDVLNSPDGVFHN